MDHPPFYIGCSRASHGQNTVGTAGDPWSHIGTSANPHTVFEGDVTHPQVEGGFLVVVIPAQEERSLGKATMIPKSDLSEVVNPNVFANPTVVSNDQFPRVLDGHAWFDDDAFPYPSSKRF